MAKIDPKIRCVYHIFLGGNLCADFDIFRVYIRAVLKNSRLGEDAPPNFTKIVAESVLQEVVNGSES